MSTRHQDIIPSEAHGDIRIPTGPAGFPIVAARGCDGRINVDGRSVYCMTCDRDVAWRQVAHTASDDRDYLRERMMLEVEYQRTTR